MSDTEVASAIDDLTKEVRLIRKVLERDVEDAILTADLPKRDPWEGDTAHDTTRPPELCPMCNLETKGSPTSDDSWYLDTPLREAKDDLEELRKAAQGVYDSWPGNRTLMSEAMHLLGLVLNPDGLYQTCPHCGVRDEAHIGDCMFDKP